MLLKLIVYQEVYSMTHASHISQHNAKCNKTNLTTLMPMCEAKVWLSYQCKSSFLKSSTLGFLLNMLDSCLLILPMVSPVAPYDSKQLFTCLPDHTIIKICYKTSLQTQRMENLSLMTMCPSYFALFLSQKESLTGQSFAHYHFHFGNFQSLSQMSCYHTSILFVPMQSSMTFSLKIHCQSRQNIRRKQTT